ncbi:MAG TPA: hypothetical protein DCO72_09560 [Ruminococcus sp.]|nr:hypothetical protein [Ruminococcus sp.]
MQGEKFFKLRKGAEQHIVLEKYIEDESPKKTTVVIPETIDVIDTLAFENCKYVKHIILLNGVLQINKKAFFHCKNLEKITISNSVQNISAGMVAFCPRLSEIEMEEEKEEDRYFRRNGYHFISIDGILYSNTYPSYYVKSPQKLICCPPMKTEVIIPESVTEIEDYAFFRCYALRVVKFPPHLERIGKGAFDYCQLFKLKIPDFDFMIKIFYTSPAYRIVTENLEIGNYHFKNIEFDYLASKDLKEVLLAVLFQKLENLTEHVAELQYAFLAQYYAMFQSQYVLDFLKKNEADTMQYIFNFEDTKSLQALFDSEQFFTQENIDQHLEYAIQKQQHEIYVLLLNYKAEKLGFKDIQDQFKL